MVEPTATLTILWPIVRQVKAAVALPSPSPAHAVFDFLLPSYFPRPTAPSSSRPATALAANGRQQLPSAPTRHVGGASSLHAQPHTELPPSQRRCCKSRLGGLLFSAGIAPTAAPTRDSLHQTRKFSSTQIRHSTRTVLNPQLDESDNEMRLEITARAAEVGLQLRFPRHCALYN